MKSRRMAIHLCKLSVEVCTGILHLPLIGDRQKQSPVLEIDVVLIVFQEAIRLPIASNRRQTSQGLSEM